MEKTFRSYTHGQGTDNAHSHCGQNPSLYQTITNHHTSTGGNLDTLLDVGCGPGTVTRSLAPHFAHAIGLDSSEGMISTARPLRSTSSTSKPIRFEVPAGGRFGTDVSPPTQDSSVDLITAGTAAHWFDMAGFWAPAAQVLRAGGTVDAKCASKPLSTDTRRSISSHSSSRAICLRETCRWLSRYRGCWSRWTRSSTSKPSSGRNGTALPKGSSLHVSNQWT